MHGGTESDNSGPLFYVENGRVVFTARYLLGRGKCCGSGCRHCPYQRVDRHRGLEDATLGLTAAEASETRTAWRSG